MKNQFTSLLGKEIKLALHPTAYLFIALGAMLAIPSYPYYVAFFYSGLAAFFTCLNGRENRDIDYTMLLPAAKKDIVDARIAVIILTELAELIAAVPFAVLRQHMPVPPNPVGMEANIALFGLSLIMLTLFNAVFFGVYYRNVQKVGKAFICGSVADFLFIAVAETVTHIIPFFRDKLDTFDNVFVGEKLAVLAVGIIIFIAGNYLIVLSARKNFEKQDL